MVLLSLTLTADTALLPVFFDLPGRTHWRLLQYSVTGPAVAVELPWLGAQLRSVNPGIPVARAGVLQPQSGTFVCNWALGQCDRMPPQVLLAFQDALAGDATVSSQYLLLRWGPYEAPAVNHTILKHSARRNSAGTRQYLETGSRQRG